MEKSVDLERIFVRSNENSMTLDDRRYRQRGIMEFISRVFRVHCHHCLFWKSCRGKKRQCGKRST